MLLVVFRIINLCFTNVSLFFLLPVTTNVYTYTVFRLHANE